ncbi:MAG: tetratricopeptide repeat protein [Phycisphaeraceae bacterium]|nr:tetratricopeptide repeat protein [Phycisphaeraceae bacterium]
MSPALRLIAALGVILSVTASSLAADTTADPSSLTAAAASAYHAGIDKLANSPAAAKADFESSIAAYRALILGQGIESGPLWYNLGNAYMMSGDVGRAIAAYLRAQRLMPASQSLSTNLADARARVPSAAAPAAREPAWASTASFTRIVPTAWQVYTFLACFALFWAVLILRMVGVRGRLTSVPASALAVISLVAFASLALQTAADARDRRAVIISPTEGLPSPGAVATSEESVSLPAGSELQATARVGEWTQVRLGDGRQMWVPSQRVEMVLDRPS